MTAFRDYLADKRAAVQAVRHRVTETNPPPKQIAVSVTATGRDGVRRVSIRDHRQLLDSSIELGGFDLGPSPVETLLGALGGCLAHTIIVQAAARSVPLDGVSIDVSATIDPRAGHPKHPEVPVHPTAITYVARIESPADHATIKRLLESAERVCPITSLLTGAHSVAGNLVHIGAA